jgi:hypothetical protein
MAANTYQAGRLGSERLAARILLVVGLVVFASGPLIANAAEAPVGLGTADSFAVLAGSGITNTGSTTITGDIGSHPTPAQTGTGACPAAGCVTLDGVNHEDDAVTQGAKADLTTAYNDAAGRTPVTTIATELGGQTLGGGVYNSAAGTFGITGTLTLDAGGNPDEVFVFQTASTLITASASSVNLLGGAQACNVFWQVGSSATLGTSSSFSGNILALTDITMTTNATAVGRVLARNGAVTLDTNTITRAACAAPTVEASPSPTPSPSATPSPTATPTTTTPVGGVETGGGSTAGVQGLDLLVAGGVLLASGLAMFALRRRVN